MKNLIVIIFGLALSLTTYAQSVPSVDLLWSANTYKPPLYGGHSHATPRSEVRVVALVAGTNTNPAQLDYRWQRDGQTLSNLSGPGRQSLTFTAGQAGENHQVQVLIAGLGEAGTITKSISIPVVTPVLSIYEDDSLLGVNYGRAIGSSLTLNQPEINLIAEPYFFSNADTQAGKMDYRWSLNGQRVVPHPTNNRLITFAAPSGASGENSITLVVDNLNNAFQTARRGFQISFGLPPGFNF